MAKMGNNNTSRIKGSGPMAATGSGPKGPHGGSTPSGESYKPTSAYVKKGGKGKMGY